MNIGIDIRCLQDKQLTGVGEYALNLLRQLFLIDKNNRYYLFANSSKKITLPDFNFPNVKICRFKYPNKLLNLSLWLIKRPRLDLLIQKKFKTPPINLFFFPNLNFFSTKCPYIITCHDLSFELFPEFFSFKQRLWHRFINPLKTFSEATALICVSRNTLTDLNSKIQAPKSPPRVDSTKNIVTRVEAGKQYPNYNSKISNFKNSRHSRYSHIRIDIYPGINDEFRKLDSYDKTLEKTRAKYGLPRNFILFLGTLEPRKNIATLIDAFEQFKITDRQDFHLVIAGKRGYNSKKLFEKIKRSKFFNNIKIIDYVEPADKVYLYNLSKLFVFPSYYEGFGFPPLEALACGTPTIISHTSSLSEVCGKAAISVDPYNINDLTEAIKISLSLNRPPQFNDRENFSWEKTARETLSVFQKLF
jgi:glycosyltransferase involved in cell wall biosynthesis